MAVAGLHGDLPLLAVGPHDAHTPVLLNPDVGEGRADMVHPGPDLGVGPPLEGGGLAAGADLARAQADVFAVDLDRVAARGRPGRRGHSNVVLTL